MSNYNKEMRGVLFKNDQKGNEKAPLYRGKIQINGEEYNLAAWLRKSKKGETFMSLLASGKQREDEYKTVDEYVPFF